MERNLRRHWLIAGALALVPITLVVAGGHRGAHAARSALVPGAGLMENAPVLALAAITAAIIATVAWLRWGTDWILALAVILAMAASAAWGTGDHAGGTSDAAIVRASHHAAHEFPIVVLIVGLLGWARTALGHVPGFGRIRGTRGRDERNTTLTDLGPVDRARAIALLAFTADDDAARAADEAQPVFARRARRIGLAARFRWSGDPFRTDHAHARAALLAAGRLGTTETQRFLDDAVRGPGGVPASEPGFVRLIDGTLAAIALDDAGDRDAGQRWTTMLAGPFAPRRGHRPAWWWTPLAIRAGRSLDWEHAAAMALAHERGWIDGEDWALLRRRVLGAAARGVSRRDDERLIAAGRIWLVLVDDPAAARIVDRPTVRHDPLARALDAYARHLGKGRRTATLPIGGAA